MVLCGAWRRLHFLTWKLSRVWNWEEWDNKSLMYDNVKASWHDRLQLYHILSHGLPCFLVDSEWKKFSYISHVKYIFAILFMYVCHVISVFWWDKYVSSSGKPGLWRDKKNRLWSDAAHSAWCLIRAWTFWTFAENAFLAFCTIWIWIIKYMEQTDLGNHCLLLNKPGFLDDVT